jgi:hypothetical protein
MHLSNDSRGLLDIPAGVVDGFGHAGGADGEGEAAVGVAAEEGYWGVGLLHRLLPAHAYRWVLEAPYHAERRAWIGDNGRGWTASPWRYWWAGRCGSLMVLSEDHRSSRQAKRRCSKSPWPSNPQPGVG